MIARGWTGRSTSRPRTSRIPPSTRRAPRSRSRPSCGASSRLRLRAEPVTRPTSVGAGPEAHHPIWGRTTQRDCLYIANGVATDKFTLRYHKYKSPCLSFIILGHRTSDILKTALRPFKIEYRFGRDMKSDLSVEKYKQKQFHLQHKLRYRPPIHDGEAHGPAASRSTPSKSIL